MKIHETRSLRIKSWSPEDRPREKLQLKGSADVTEAELLAILLGSGTPAATALDLAKELLRMANHNLDRLARMTYKDLIRIKGIGAARAITILAAFELGRRRKEVPEENQVRVTTSSDAFDVLCKDMMDLPHEEFWILLMNKANILIKKQRVSIGGVSTTIADPKIIFKFALEELASTIIVAHNHPSGNPTPSYSDFELTRKLKHSADMLEINLLDHIIIAGRGFYSFSDEGKL
jgi:DNA repair protein RadC